MVSIGCSKGLRHRYQKKKNKLLKVCYVPATSATFLAFFLAVAIKSKQNQTRQAIRAPLSSLYYLDVYGLRALKTKR